MAGRLFWCQGEGGAPGPAASAPCRSQDAFVRRFPEDRESAPPWNVSRGEGILCLPRSQGAATQRVPAMLPSFLLAGGAGNSAMPTPGAPGELPRAPTPHPNAPRSGSSTQSPLSPQAGPGDICGHSWEALAQREVVHIPCRRAEPSGGTPAAVAQSLSPAGLALARPHCGKGKGCRVRREGQAAPRWV